MVEIITDILLKYILSILGAISGGALLYYLHRRRIKFENKKSHTEKVKQVIDGLLSCIQNEPSHIVKLDKIICDNYYISKDCNPSLVKDLVENHSTVVKILWNGIATNQENYSKTERELRSKIKNAIMSKCKERNLKYRLDNTNDYDCLLIDGLVELVMRDLRGMHKLELDVKGKYIYAGAYRLWQDSLFSDLFLHNIKENIEDIILIIEDNPELIRLADKLNQLDSNINETKKLLCNELQELLAMEVLKDDCKFTEI